MCKPRKSTLPAIIPNQPQSWWGWGGSDGAKFTAENQKNERNRMNLIRKAERCARSLSVALSLSKGLLKGNPLIRAKTRIVIYKSVRTINN